MVISFNKLFVADNFSDGGPALSFPKASSLRQHRCKAVIEKIKNLPVGGGLPNVLVY